MSADKTATVKRNASSAELSLSTLAPTPGSRRRRKRLGIGEGSGNGKTAGKGQKGARMRSGYSLNAGFEGGQMPLHRRLPKVGFTSRKKTLGVNRYTVVSIDLIAAKIAEGVLTAEVTSEALVSAGLVRSLKEQVKIVGGRGGENRTPPKLGKLTLKVHAVTQSVKSAVEDAGGTIDLS